MGLIERKEDIRKSVRSVLAEPWCALSLVFFLYMGGAAVDKYLLENQPVTGALTFAWERALAFAQLSVVQLLMLPFALWMFAHGVRKIIARRDAEMAENIAANKAETAIRQRIAEIPTLLAKIASFKRELEIFAKKIGGLKEIHTRRIEHADKFKSDFEWVGARQPNPFMPMNLDQFGHDHFDFRNFSVDAPKPIDPAWPSPNMEKRQETMGNMRVVSIYKADMNGAYIAAWDTNVSNMRDWLGHVEKTYYEQSRILADMEAKLEMNVVSLK